MGNIMAKTEKNTHIVVKQRKSLIGQAERTRLTVRGLGLRKINHEVKLQDTPAIRGMILKVQHLVDVKVCLGKTELFGARHR